LQPQHNLHAIQIVAVSRYAQNAIEFCRPHTVHALNVIAQGHWKVQLDYRLSHDALGEIYVQNQELHTHGVGTPDLGLGACRAAQIANQLAGYPLYEVSEQAQCFQHFQPENNPELSLLMTTAQVVPMQEHFCIKKPISRAQVFESKSQQPQKNNAFEKIL
jgi:lysine N6-hydroxylase